MSQTLYTVGHSRRSIDELIALLTRAEVRQLVDVRAYPRSARYPWFNDAALRPVLEQAGVAYRWLGRELGGLREQQPGSRHIALPAGGLRAFADYMETPAFSRAMEILIEAATRTSTAIMCAEASPMQCHRGLIADCLVARGARVLHLLDIGETQTHALRPAAREEGGRLIYDRTTQQGLKLE